ncbi:geranylgeranyl pyrophosphate synthase [Desulfosporosinus orientis DSM 765]|uniref:Geranylgeranyl pyrophosphate synthase n=1 Tax=Desulfosporosinus orientis (strain ATCC 19365 / DSM 765 / NCIMB 8382 / VKM B-1628 / Singapore I) TaxID=768706 RepID=G7W509_DESOD|nr:polyprenyl synthetase family protein [Desulfosporosinus orientis]AET65881.1 geranylgeranyl pyrophosphate synthase [Desulfosporosinus orientis DSM 765]
MGHLLNQVIIKEINELLVKKQINQEMINMIGSAYRAESITEELFPWANLTFLSCECVGGIPEVALPGAIGMELFALAADIFDDIQDQDNDNLPWRKLENAEALNLALCLLMLSYEAISQIPESELYRNIHKIINETGLCAIDGQFRELRHSDNDLVSLDQYFKLVRQKSGSLTACSCSIGAMLGRGSEALVSNLRCFGINLGIMCQIRNDLSDFFDYEKKNNFINNTKTLPYVYLLNILRSQPEHYKELLTLQNKGLRSFESKEREQLAKIAADEGVAQYCKVMYEIYRQKALNILREIPVPKKDKEKLIKLVEESV